MEHDLVIGDKYGVPSNIIIHEGVGSVGVGGESFGAVMKASTASGKTQCVN